MNDSLHSLFLAQAMGLYLLIMGIVMLSRAGYYQPKLANIKIGDDSITAMATLGLILGISLVLVHNIWIWESEVMITVVAWLLLVKSVLWLSFPEFMVKCSHKLYSGWGYYAMAVIACLIGILLMSHGFFLFLFPQ